MALIKIKTPVFAGGVRIHNTGDVVELPLADAGKYLRRGWGEENTAPKADATKEGSEKGRDKK